MKRKYNPKNERAKRKYCIWIQEARRKSERTVDQALAAISLFELSTGGKDFASFHIEQARAFKRGLAEDPNPATGKPYAMATIKGRLDAVKAFFLWLADQSGYRSRITHADSEYFNFSANNSRIATARRERPAPDVDQVKYALSMMPAETTLERRDRAILAFALLTGVRDGALISLSLRHVDMAERLVFQDARTVRTKFRKTFTTWFFPVGGDAEAIVGEWIWHLRDKLKFGPDDPLFPPTGIGLDCNGHFAPAGFRREHWKNADPVRRVFKDAFQRAGLPAYHPHSIRKTLVRLGEKVCRTPEEFKAWSQNLGHEDVITTFRSYGTVQQERQAELILGMSREQAAPAQDDAERRLARMVAEEMAKLKVGMDS